ncbi:MAG: amidase [Pigmentiphaga sp.]|nr:amidase [Pigmentiphaga sp.]
MSGKYDPATFIQRTFHDARERFLRDEESPVAYFRSCVKQIEELEPSVKAWASLRLEDALRDAAASEARYRAKRPLSLIDGMPIGIKDVLSTKDMPTNFGIIGNENHTRFDSPIAQALRDAGAIILGKTTTTELAFGDPSETKNPFDLTRTPGGSSSGSGAAVGARMVPAAIGTQVGGSLIRPASYNANFALKPTIGGLNRGEDLNYSHLACGVHAGSLIDMWRVTIEIAKRVGGDPGYLGVVGNDDLANACVPQTIALIETEGWSETEQTTRDGFHAFRTQLESAGITTLTKDNNVHIRRFEQVIANAKELTLGIIAWEGQWYLGRMLGKG